MVVAQCDRMRKKTILLGGVKWSGVLGVGLFYSAIEYIDVPHMFPLLVLRLIGDYGGTLIKQ